jgi:RNA polymerase sigma-70 factor (ECF subfamily)
MDIEEERRIIRQVRDGAVDAYAELVAAYQKAVYNLVFRLTGSVQDAEDLSQDAFLKALEGIHGFDESRRFFPWLYTIALNVVRNHRRRRPNRPSPGSIPPAHLSGGPNPERLLGQKQTAEALFDCIRQLPAQQQEAVVLRYYQEVSFETLADILQVSLSTAKMRVYRGLQRLSELMQPQGSDLPPAHREETGAAQGEK